MMEENYIYLDERLIDLENRCSTAYKIAIERIETKGEIGASILHILTDSFHIFLSQFTRFPHFSSKSSSLQLDSASDRDAEDTSSKTSRFAENSLLKVLNLHLSIAKNDSILYEEIGRAGSHQILARIMKMDPHEGESIASDWNDAEYDDFFDIIDVACEIGSVCCPSFPLPVSPFTREDILHRLPLIFPIIIGDSDENQVCEETQRSKKNVLIHQVQDRQSAQHDVGFVMWPSAVFLAQWIAANPSCIQNKCILELGAGCGLSGIAAAITARFFSMDSFNILLTDFNEKVICNLRRNIILNDLNDIVNCNGMSIVQTAKLDFYMHNYNENSHCNNVYYESDGEHKDEEFSNGMKIGRGWIDGHTGEIRDQVDIILGADIICKPEDATAVSKTIYSALKVGGKAILVCGDSSHRFGMDVFKEELEKVDGLKVSCQCISGMEDNNSFLCNKIMSKIDEGLHLTSGYVNGMKLQFIQVTKVN